MNLPKELTARISDHLSNVRKNLGGLPADEQKEILQSIEAHIYDALESRSGGKPTSALLDAVLAEMDPPESYGERRPTKQLGSVMKPFVSTAVVLTAILVIRAAFGSSKGSIPAHTADKSKQPPVVANTFPTNGDNTVDPNTAELRVTFNKDMLTDRMWSWCTESQDTSPKFVSGGTKFIDKRTCVTPVELEPNKTYVIWINTQNHNAFRDIYHTPAVPYRLEFRTGNAQSSPYSLPYKQPAPDNPVGRWVSVDFVSAPEQFNPQVKSWPKELYLKALTFQSNGQTDRSFWSWSKGILHHSGDNTDVKFFIRQINGEDYLFMEWISGDVMLRGQQPEYYVLKRENLQIAQPSQLKPVAFEQTPRTFKAGDDIVLNEVLCSSPQFETGDTVIVKGQYTLSSQSEATLLLTCTGGQSATTETQRKYITKGCGEFELTYVIPYQGCSHLAFYDTVTRKSFGNLWFGTKKQVEEIEPTRKSMQAANPDNDAVKIEKKQPEEEPRAKTTDEQKGETMKQSMTLTATAIIAATNLIAGEAKTGGSLQANTSSAVSAAGSSAEVRKASDGTIAEQKEKARHRMREDLKIYSQDELRKIESLYQVANKQWRSEEGKESLRTLISKYKSANRTGCALLYLGQMSKGDEQIEYLQQAIDGFSDCFYGDGAQVGAYARFVLWYRYHNDGEQEKAEKLEKEIKADYPEAIDHRGRNIVALLEANKP